MAGLRGDGWDAFTAEEVAGVKSIFPSVLVDAKLLENVNDVRRHIMESSAADEESPYGSVVAMLFMAQQVHRLSQSNHNETAIMEALFASFPDNIKQKLEEDQTSYPRTSKTYGGSSGHKAASTESAALQEFERGLKKPISILYRLRDGRTYENALKDHFQNGTFNTSTRAFGCSYKLFAMMAQEETLLMILEAWETMIYSRVAGNNDDIPTLPAGTTSAVRDICQTIQMLAKPEAKGLEVNIRYWDAIYTLDMQKTDFLKELDQYSLVSEKLEKINAQMIILDVGKEFCTPAPGRTIASHVEYFSCCVASKYGLGDEKGQRRRNRQGLLTKNLVRIYGKGILAFLALDGYKSIAQSMQADIVSDLALFTQHETEVQKLLDHLCEYLVEPILSNQRVSEHDMNRLAELLVSGDWSSLE